MAWVIDAFVLTQINVRVAEAIGLEKGEECLKSESHHKLD